MAIPFERIIPSHVEHDRPSGEYALRRGPQMLAVIADSAMWPAIWRAAVDSVKTPPVAFGDAVLVLAATKRYPTGPTELRVTSIRQCRRTGVVVVSTMETGPNVMGISMASRGFDLVRVPGRVLAEGVVMFDQRVRFVPE
jgi:hypothetical protein